MKNVLIASSARPDAETGLPEGFPDNAVSGQWPDYNGAPVYDCMIGDNDPLPTGTVLGVWDYRTGTATQRRVDVKPSETRDQDGRRQVTYDGSGTAQVHQWAGQAGRDYR